LNNGEYEDIKLFSKNLRKNILKMSLGAGASSSHFGGGLSLVEIISVLYCKFLNLDNEVMEPDRNRFILSKGHGVLPYYCALYQKGFLKESDLEKFEKTDGFLFGHPIMNKKVGIEFSTGSLGMGLGIGVGLAISYKLKKKNNHTYVIIGDGECNEGSIWEAAMCASHHKLDNLTVVLDNNGFQQTGSNNDINKSQNFKDKWQSFGFKVIEIDGHNIGALIDGFKEASNIPKLILAKTVKGKGFSFSENNNEWHHKVLTKKNYEEAINELDNNEN